MTKPPTPQWTPTIARRRSGEERVGALLTTDDALPQGGPPSLFQGLNDAEIAAVMGCGQATVRSNTSRALRALRIHLHDTKDAPAGAPLSLVLKEN